eukprot:3500601-Amphidinium_carterae.1
MGAATPTTPFTNSALVTPNSADHVTFSNFGPGKDSPSTLPEGLQSSAVGHTDKMSRTCKALWGPSSHASYCSHGYKHRINVFARTFGCNVVPLE